MKVSDRWLRQLDRSRDQGPADPSWKYLVIHAQRGRRWNPMDCSLCGREVVVEMTSDGGVPCRNGHVHDSILAAGACNTESTSPVFCKACVAHNAEKCWPFCGACRIIALFGYNMGKVTRLTDAEMLGVMWRFERGAIVWQAMDSRRLVVISRSVENPSLVLNVDDKGWCSRV